VKRVLVTGASGFIGRFSIEPLRRRGFEVHAISSRAAPLDGLPSAMWHRCDLLTPGEAGRIVDAIRPTHILHLAWYATPGRYWTAPENVEWVAASAALMRAFERTGGQRFVGAGTAAEYASSAVDCVEGSTPLAPATLYGACKHAVHTVLESFAADRFSAAWGRIFHLYGPHEPGSRLMPAVIRALLEGNEALCTEGSQVRDFMYVEDVAEAFAALVASDVERAVNIATGTPMRLADIIGRIGAQLEAGERIRLGARPIPPGELPRVTASVARLRDEVGWSGARDLDRGLAATIEWWRQALGDS
jgi:nucleoside-diphosphate-sugar epimerase